jgi:amino acid permease
MRVCVRVRLPLYVYMCICGYGVVCDTFTHVHLWPLLSDEGGVWPALSGIVIVLLVLSIVGTYPLQLMVVYDLLEAWLFGSGRLNPHKHKFWKQNAVRATLVGVTVAVAVLFPSFDVLVNLVGSVGSSALQFVFPSLFFLRLKWDEISIPYRALVASYAVLGVCAGLLGTGQTVYGLIWSDEV